MAWSSKARREIEIDVKRTFRRFARIDVADPAIQEQLKKCSLDKAEVDPYGQHASYLPPWHLRLPDGRVTQAEYGPKTISKYQELNKQYQDRDHWREDADLRENTKYQDVIARERFFIGLITDAEMTVYLRVFMSGQRPQQVATELNIKTTEVKAMITRIIKLSRISD